MALELTARKITKQRASFKINSSFLVHFDLLRMQKKKKEKKRKEKKERRKKEKTELMENQLPGS